MSKPTKKAVAALDAASLLGEVALVRSSIWMNGQRKVPAMITEAITDAALLPEGAVALVSLTAFVPGAPSRLMRDVPLFPSDLGDAMLPLAWLKTAG